MAGCQGEGRLLREEKCSIGSGKSESMNQKQHLTHHHQKGRGRGAGRTHSHLPLTSIGFQCARSSISSLLLLQGITVFLLSCPLMTWIESPWGGLCPIAWRHLRLVSLALSCLFACQVKDGSLVESFKKIRWSLQGDWEPGTGKGETCDSFLSAEL